MKRSELECPFCAIAAAPADDERIFYKDTLVTVFQDILPITPVHLLIIPNRHISSVNEMTAEDETMLGHMILVGAQMAEKNGIKESGYRLVINTGPDAGQSVFHIHLHLIGGRRMPFRFE